MKEVTGITLRPATLRDLDLLLPLVQAYRVFYKQQAQPEDERRFIEAHLRNGTSVIYVAECYDALAGFMQLFKTYSTVHLANSWILEDLFVAPEYRSRGIAAALLNRAQQHARQDGASGMFLETAFDNEPAQRVYERAGWTREGRFYKYNAPLAAP
jgi:ribosomal protein S18 acetylase RimI-like enzyme